VSRRSQLITLLTLLCVALQAPLTWSAGAAPAPAIPAPLPAGLPAAAANGVSSPLIALGPGDALTLHVYGQPEMDGPVSVADDGSIRVPLAGAVQVGGLSPEVAGRRVEQALKEGRFFLDPHVELTVTQALSQRVSVVGEVHLPGRYPIDSRTTVVDLLAQAGGITDLGSDMVYVLRPDAAGNSTRYPVNLKGLSDPKGTTPTMRVRGGDSLFVPRAEQFSILGEVQKPSIYKLQPNLTVEQAISLAGGLTPKGSERRVEIRRHGPDGKEVSIKPKLDDFIQADDVIRVKESIF
jgi:polysaccharide export outer membrane protein